MKEEVKKTAKRPALTPGFQPGIFRDGNGLEKRGQADIPPPPQGTCCGSQALALLAYFLP